jgi:hypothetical protein
MDAFEFMCKVFVFGLWMMIGLGVIAGLIIGMGIGSHFF